jgi:hypothetical protein
LNGRSASRSNAAGGRRDADRMMWIVFEIEENGLTDDLARVIGPFLTREEAEAYCTIHNLDGVMEVELPEP